MADILLAIRVATALAVLLQNIAANGDLTDDERAELSRITAQLESLKPLPVEAPAND